MRNSLCHAVGCCCLFSCFLQTPYAFGQQLVSPLERELLSVPATTLADEATRFGDAKRGAVLFYQPQMACRQCHSVDGSKSPLGPALSEKRPDATDAFLVESVLTPSKSIRKEFQAAVVVTDDGKVIIGLVVEESPEKVVLQEGRPLGKLLEIPRSSIDEFKSINQSIMPPGQMGTLASRQQFLDLIRYLIEIRDGGALRAKELEPPESLYAIRIPEYENDIDHAAMIADLDDAAFKRGQAIYSRLCVNCHGTHDKPGSLPTSLRFATGRFRSGSDPHTMYQTLTRGFGMMIAQTWMVPQQKYDVIHYVREAYLKEHNPTQHFSISDEYLAGLPKGKSRGPEPVQNEPWITMDYGPSLVNTYEVGNDASNFAYKGIAVRLDPGPGGISRGRSWMILDHDTMRMAAAWAGDGFIDWQGIHMNGRHNIHPRIQGDVHLANPTGSGWANPENGSFGDPRLHGRDDRLYGPLPRKWAHLKGIYHHGQKTIVEYTVGDTLVREMPGLGTIISDDAKGAPVFTRTFNIGSRSRDMILKVAQVSEGSEILATLDQKTQGLAVSHGLSVTWDAKTRQVQLFVDGKPEQTRELATQKPLRDAVLRIGFTNENFPGPQSFFDGDLRDVRFYQRRLSDVELGKPDLLPVGKAQIAHWKLDGTNTAAKKSDEDSSETVLDSSGNNHSGQIHSGGNSAKEDQQLAAGILPAIPGAMFESLNDGSLTLKLPAGDEPLRFTLWSRRQNSEISLKEMTAEFVIEDADADLSKRLNGGPARWPTKLATTPVIGSDDGAFAVDVLTHPADNPWLAQTRLTGFDFLPDGDQVAVCAWDGDVWMVSGLSQLPNDHSELSVDNPPKLTWQRIASGLFQPLGLKYVDGKIFVTCRDQITIHH